MKKYIALGCLLTAFNLFTANYSQVDTVNIKNNAEAIVKLTVRIRKSQTHIENVNPYPILKHGETYGPITRSDLVFLSFKVPSSFYPDYEYTVDLTKPGSLEITLHYSYVSGYYSEVKTVQPPTPPIRTQAYIPDVLLMQALDAFMTLHKNSTAPEIKKLLIAGLSIDEIARIHPYLLLGFPTAAHNIADARKTYNDLKKTQLIKNNEVGTRLVRIAYYHMPSVMIGLGNEIVANPNMISGIKELFPDEREYTRYLAMIISVTQQQREMEKEKEQTTPPPLPSSPIIQPSTTATPPPLPPRPSSKPATLLTKEEKISSTALQQQIGKLKKPAPQEKQPTKPSKGGRFNLDELQQQKDRLKKPAELKQPALAPAKELSLQEMLKKGIAAKFIKAKDKDKDEEDINSDKDEEGIDSDNDWKN